MGRIPYLPNKQCSNCMSWAGPREFDKGLVVFDICHKYPDRKAISGQLCSQYDYYRKDKIFEDTEKGRKLAKSKKDTICKFRVANDWTCCNSVVNIDFLTIHWEKQNCFWICILGISFIWEHLKTKERNKW